jgi:deoxyadenosine/deoxycytidine kinase
MNKLITVIGPSGIGKTSLVNRLAATGRFETAFEQHAQRPFQALAKDDSRFTFANQMDYLLLRAKQEQTLRASSKIGLMDGGLDLDFHGFTRLFLSRNLLSPNEFDLCRRFYDLIRTNTPAPELTVRLKADEETVSGRLSRRKRINIAGAEDTALFESFLDDWLEGIHPNQILELDVTNETLEYNQSIHAILQKVSELE